jgi:transposase
LKLDVVLVESGTPACSEHFSMDHNPKGVKAIIDLLNKRKIDVGHVLFCCENTGVYKYPFNNHLSEKNLYYWVVAAFDIERSKDVFRGKHDKIDARDIALYNSWNIEKLKLSSLVEKQIQ